MARMIKRLFTVAVTLVLAAAFTAPPMPTDAQSVLRVAKGLKSNNVAVLIDRAVVLESAVRFVEVSVANPEIADVQPISDRSIYIFGRRRGVTSLTLLGENGTLITNVVIKVEADHSEMKERLRQLLPNEPIEVRTANGGLILSGVVSGKAKIDRAMALARAYAGDSVTNMMTVGGTQQVMLKVKVAEINRGNAKDIGISLTTTGGPNGFTTDFLTGENLRRVDTDGDGLAETLASVVPGAGQFAGAFGAAFTLANNFLVNVQLDALESKGFAKTLSEPNLVALSGTKASFLAGGEVPIPVVGDDGDVTVEFKDVGVGIEFVPVVLDDDLINITLTAEVSQVDPAVSTNTGGIEVVGFQTRRATTTIELKDGQAFAIAGLLQDSFEDTISQVPWLADLPVLGTLFRSTNFQRGESELVIFVSAHLVTPVDSADDLALPTDRVTIPNEAQLFLLGRPEGTEPSGFTGSSIGNATFDGEFGYVLE